MPRAASLPGGLPSTATSPSTSRMSSWIWKASPTRRRIRRSARSCASARSGPTVRGQQHARADQRAGLEPVHAARPAASVSTPAFGLEVDRLAAGHAGGAARVGQRVDACVRGSPGPAAMPGCARQQLERQRLQRVAGEDRGRLVEGLVAGRAAAAQVVVVHRRQVVVDQAIAVDQLDGAGGRVDMSRAARRALPPSRRPAPGACACRRRARCSAGRVQAFGDGRLRPAATVEFALHPQAPRVELVRSASRGDAAAAEAGLIRLPARRSPVPRRPPSAAGSPPSARPA